MKYIDHSLYYEAVPETQQDREFIKCAYPMHKGYMSICFPVECIKYHQDKYSEFLLKANRV